MRYCNWLFVLLTLASLDPRLAIAGAFCNPVTLRDPHLQNLLQVAKTIYCGGEPKGDAAYKSLVDLGVRTLVSVDGGQPNLSRAGTHGLRYVHIPIGYDGVSDTAGRMFAKLIREVEGPFYIHCHHGRQRGPAAAAIACIALGGVDGASALKILRKAGTSEHYGGLWRSVRSYVPPEPDAKLPELVAAAKVESLTKAMFGINRAFDNLRLVKTAGWKTPPQHPDILARHEALLLKEGFRESARRSVESNDFDRRFREWLKEAEATAAALEEAIVSNAQSASKRFVAVEQQCNRCHTKYRD